MSAFRPAMWVLAGVCLVAGVAPAADPAKAMIDQLPEVDRQDTGYSGASSGTAFLPFGRNETGVVLLAPRQGKFGSSDAMRSLVKLGVKAVPALLDHLADDRPTKIVIDVSGALTDFKKRKYTVRVGDLCYVALGQIVNREYTTVEYIPTAIVIVNGVPGNKQLHADVVKEWGKLTADSHRDALAKDLGSDDRSRRVGAAVRLAYYYPDALEPLVLEQLARPGAVDDLGPLIDSLQYDRSAKIDRAVRDILEKTDSDYMGFICMNRLIGRGYDADIEAFIKRRLPKAKDERDVESYRNYEAKLGWTWLHKMAELDVRDLTEKAINEADDINAKTKDGRTPLHIAAAAGRLDAVQQLLAANADRKAKDANGRTPLDLAKQGKHTAVINRLGGSR